MRKYVILLFAILLLISCKKKSTVHITAKNAVTGNPYPGLHYDIVRSKTGMFESHYKIVASGALDENGEAFITKRFSKNWSHQIRLKSPDNNCYHGNKNYGFSGGENIEADFKFAECAYLKLNINNVNCQDSNDLMQFRSRYPYSNWEGWSTERYGCYYFSLSYYMSVTAGYRIYEVKVTRNNTTVLHYDTVYLEAGEYTIYDLDY